MRGDPAEACSHYEHALTLYRKVGERDGTAWSLYQVAHFASLRGEYTRARTLLEESLAIRREQGKGNKRTITDLLFRLAEVLFLSQDEPAMVHCLLEEGLVLSREMGNKEGIANSFLLLGRVALTQGDAVTAHVWAEQSLILYREIEERLRMRLSPAPWSYPGIARSLSFLAKVATIQEDYAAAFALYEESLTIAKVADHKWEIAFCLEGLAEVALAEGQPVQAARLCGAAEALRKANGTPIPPVYRADYERMVTDTRKQLGEQAFAATWAQGQAMTLDQVLAAQREMSIAEPVSTISPVSQPPPPAKTSPKYPAGLTEREVEVLRLLAQGLTNAQIAEQFVLSIHTVNAHVRSIFTKINVTSRSAATRFAFEHHLV